MCEFTAAELPESANGTPATGLTCAPHDLAELEAVPLLSDIAVPEKEVQTSDPEELRDLLETSFKTSYYPTTLDRIQLRPEGTIKCDDLRMPCAQGFLESLADSIRMPLGYAYQLDGALLAENFERRKDRCSTAVTICHNRGTAVNLAGAEYRPARTVDVLPGLLDAPFWKFDGARVSDRGVEINYLQPGCAVTPSKGDVIELGIRISNSETGYPGLKGSLFSLRLVCTNGAVMSDQLGAARWNYDPRVAYTTSIEKFWNDLFKLRGRQDGQARLYDGLMQRRFLDREIVNLWRRLRSSLPSAMVDSVLGLPPVERQAIQAAVRQRPQGVPAEPTSLSVWDIHNRITATAQRLDFVRRSRLERLGGGLLFDISLN